MTTDETFVIVGAGLAGAQAAQTLRAEGFDELMHASVAVDDRRLADPVVGLESLLPIAEGSAS